MSQLARDIQQAALPNGVTIVTERMPQVRSVSVGIWLGSGSRAESPERNGVAHFIEHMVFKGTRKRTAEEIAQSVDSVGGMLDAFTGKEMTCFNAKVLDEHLPVAVDVLCDLVLHPRFDDADIAKEKQVVLEEIKMEEDNPEYLIHELFTQNFWRGHPLGRPILGTPETVTQFAQGGVRECFEEWYAPNRAVITAAGNLEHARLVDLVAREFEGAPRSHDAAKSVPPEMRATVEQRDKKDLEQVHIVLGVPSYPLAHERRYAASILNVILGGGMSSRLFQNIRERQGLAYAIESDLSPYTDSGVLSVYAGTSRESAAQLIHCVCDEFRAVRGNGVSEQELRRAKDHLKGSMMLSLESTSARMSNLARQAMYLHRFISLDEMLASIEAVTREEVHTIAQEFFEPERISLSVLGNLNGFRATRELLA
ncbi:MAG TPA: pitrilysin family protein [Verrucomicrobiae bacterium]|jgi:predicted Zn-dependent peptidase|nr:pitrilysin family protein [Verrucomicrobiae bacterium]